MNFLEQYAKNEIVQSAAVLAALCLLAVVLGKSHGKRQGEQDFIADLAQLQGSSLPGSTKSKSVLEKILGL